MTTRSVSALASFDLVIAVGSVDGVLTTAAALRLNGNPEIEVVFCQAFTVDKLPVSTWNNRKVVLVDLAVNNRDPAMTKNFVEALRAGDNEIIAIIDEHDRKAWLEVLGTFEGLAIEPQSQIDEGGPKSSGEVLRRALEADGKEINGHTLQLLRDADAADRMDFSGPFAAIVNQAVKSAITDDSRRVRLAWHFSMNTVPDTKIDGWVAEYEEILRNHKRIFGNRQGLGDNIVRISTLGVVIDMTTLMSEMYKDAKVVVVEGELFNPAKKLKERMVSFGTNQKLDILAAIKAVVPNASGFATKVNVAPEHEAAALAAVRALLLAQ